MQRRGRSLREALLETALETFASQGYDGTAISELADTHDVSKAAVSYHFRTKDDLLRALVDPFLRQLDGVRRAYPKQPVADVRALLCDYLDVLVEHRRLASWIDGDAAVRNHPDIGPRLGRHHQLMRAALVGDATADIDQLRASSALGCLWRPLRILEHIDLAAHRDELVDAALARLDGR